MCDVFGEIVDVKAQLACMFRQKLAELKVNCNQAAKTSVEKQQVKVVMSVSYRYPELPADEAEFAPELEHKLLKMIKECLFEAPFCHRHVLFDAQELKYVWISELRFWSIWDGSLTGKFENLVAFLTQADALEQEAVLLAL